MSLNFKSEIDADSKIDTVLSGNDISDTGQITLPGGKMFQVENLILDGQMVLNEKVKPILTEAQKERIASLVNAVLANKDSSKKLTSPSLKTITITQEPKAKDQVKIIATLLDKTFGKKTTQTMELTIPFQSAHRSSVISEQLDSELKLRDAHRSSGVSSVIDEHPIDEDAPLIDKQEPNFDKKAKRKPAKDAAPTFSRSTSTLLGRSLWDQTSTVELWKRATQASKNYFKEGDPDQTIGQKAGRRVVKACIALASRVHFLFTGGIEILGDLGKMVVGPLRLIGEVYSYNIKRTEKLKIWGHFAWQYLTAPFVRTLKTALLGTVGTSTISVNQAMSRSANMKQLSPRKLERIQKYNRFQASLLSLLPPKWLSLESAVRKLAEAQQEKENLIAERTKMKMMSSSQRQAYLAEQKAEHLRHLEANKRRADDAAKHKVTSNKPSEEQQPLLEEENMNRSLSENRSSPELSPSLSPSKEHAPQSKDKYGSWLNTLVTKKLTQWNNLNEDEKKRIIGQYIFLFNHRNEKDFLTLESRRRMIAIYHDMHQHAQKMSMPFPKLPKHPPKPSRPKQSSE